MLDPSPMDLPRWQWRTFAPNHGTLGFLDRATAGEPWQDEETVILNGSSTHHAILRDGTLELKWRKEIAPNGLELWDSVLNAPLPFQATHLPRFFNAWGLPSPPPGRACYTGDQFLEEILAPARTLAAVRVARRCRTLTLDGVTCTLARLDLSGHTLETLALEHEDPALLADLLRQLKLDAVPNTCYPLGLKSALGLPAVS